MKSIFDLAGKVVLVTGGGGLLGQAFGRGICASGGKLIIAEKTISLAETARENILSEYPDAVIKVVHLDITSEQSVRQGLSECLTEFDCIDALVNNAYPRNKNYG